MKKNNQNMVSYILIFGIVLMVVGSLLAKFLNLNEKFYFVIVGMFAVLLFAAIIFFATSFVAQSKENKKSGKNSDIEPSDKYVYYIGSYIGVVIFSFLIMFLGTIGIGINADTISQGDTKIARFLLYGFPAIFLLLASAVTTVILAVLAIKKTSLLRYMLCSCIFAGSAVLIYLLVGIFY